MCGRKRQVGLRQCWGKGRTISLRSAGIRFAGGKREQLWCRHSKFFHRQEYYPVPRLTLTLLKWMYSYCICSPKTGIMLFVNQRGYIHLEHRCRHRPYLCSFAVVKHLGWVYNQVPTVRSGITSLAVITRERSDYGPPPLSCVRMSDVCPWSQTADWPETP